MTMMNILVGTIYPVFRSAIACVVMIRAVSTYT